MSSSTVYDAFKSRLVDQLGATYPVRDWEEIEVALQQGTAPWLAMEDSGATDDLTSIGTPQQNWVEDTGFFDVHVFVPVTGGLPPARTICDLVRDAFRYYRPAVPVGETLRVMNVNAGEPGIYHDGLWHSMLTTIEYTHRYVVATAAE